MAFTQDFRTQRRNYEDGETRIGEKDRLWYDSVTNTIRISDGETPGGIVVGGGEGGGSYTLPTASTTVKGGVKVDGTTITISNQVISATQPDLSSYATQTYVTTRGYITSYTETDPVFLAHPANNVTNTKISNWDTAYGWGNHANAGYLTSVGTVSYNDLSNKPTLFSGSYTDLTDKPTLFSGSYTDLTDKPTIPTVPTNISEFTNDAGYLTTIGTISYTDLTDKPTLFSGSYTDLTDKPTLFSGAYADLTGLPTIPTDIADLTDNTNLLSSGTSVFSNQYSLTATTTNATETELLVGGSTRIPVATNKSVNYIVQIAARRTDTPGDYAFFELRGVVANENDTVSDIGTIFEIIVVRTNPGYLVDARADNINNTINVFVTGVSDQTINWKAVVQTIEI